MLFLMIFVQAGWRGCSRSWTWLGRVVAPPPASSRRRSRIRTRCAGSATFTSTRSGPAPYSPRSQSWLTGWRLSALSIPRYNLLATWRDKSGPPCRRVADTSRHLCGGPSSYCLTSVCPCGFSPVLLFAYIFFTSYNSQFTCSFIFCLRCKERIILSHFSFCIPYWSFSRRYMVNT